MRLILTGILFFISSVLFAQVDSISLKDAMMKLDKSLLEKEYTQLSLLLCEEVSYGHSNGWVENKQDIINDLKTAKLEYRKIMNTSVAIAAISNESATVRTNTEVEGTVNGTAFQLKLHVLQVWIKTKVGWQLLARQSTKL